MMAYCFRSKLLAIKGAFILAVAGMIVKSFYGALQAMRRFPHI
jgi:hypothetical protein